MAEAEDFSAFLDQLLSSENSGEKSENSQGGNESKQEENPFGDIDMEAIMRMFEMFSEMNKPDKNTALLYALKPHLREENKRKVDTAAKLLKLMTILPLLKDSGMFDKLF